MIDRYKLFYRTFVIVFWVSQCMGFVSEELLPPLSALRQPVQLLFDIVIAFLGFVTLRHNHNKGDNRLVISFFVLAVVSTIIINHVGWLMMFNGVRDFVGLLFVMPLFRYLSTDQSDGATFVAKFDRQLMIYLWLQAVCVTWQFFKYGAGDHVGGTMGFGASGLLSISIYFISFYLMSKRWDDDKNYFSNLKQNFALIFLLYPTFLNETKVSFITLLFYFLLLIKLDRAAVVKFVAAIPLMAVLLVGVGAAYLDITDQDADKVVSTDFFDEYLFGGDELELLIDVGLAVQDGTIEVDPSEIWTIDIPRFAKLFWAPMILKDARGGLLLGAGVGQFKGGQTMQLTQFAKDNQWIFIGTRPWLFFVIVQLGLFGVLWYLYSAKILIDWKHSENRCKNLKIYLGIIICVILCYSDLWRYLQFCFIFYYVSMAATLTVGVGKPMTGSASDEHVAV